MADERLRVDNPDVQHETTDVNIRGVLTFAIGLIVAAVLIHFAVWILFRVLGDEYPRRGPVEYPLAATTERRVPPAPRLQPSPPDWRTPREDLHDFRRAEDEILNTYGWADRNAGAVRIPISEAMKLTVQRGLPAREEKR